MPAAGSCRVCAHPEEGRLRGARAAGASWRDLSREFGLPPTTIRDHLNRCQGRAASRSRRPTGPGWEAFWSVLFDVLGEFPEAELALRGRLEAFMAGDGRLPAEILARLRARTEEHRG